MSRIALEDAAMVEPVETGKDAPKAKPVRKRSMKRTIAFGVFVRRFARGRPCSGAGAFA